MTTTVTVPARDKLRRIMTMIATAINTFLILTLTVGATSGDAAGTTSSAITDVGTALTGVIGYMAQTTAAILGDDLWILGMGFFVLSFVAGFVMYLFRVGRR